MHRLKRRPLTEAEEEYYTQQASESSWFTHNEVCIKAGAIQSQVAVPLPPRPLSAHAMAREMPI